MLGKIKPPPVFTGEQDLAALRDRLSRLDPNGSHRRFLVNRMGSTGSTWLVKLLNAHPDVFCYHEGVLTQIFPATSYGSDAVVNFLRWLVEHDMHGAYHAVGDVGSVWTGHIQALPQGLFTTGMLLRHPARVLNTRLKVFQKDQSFTEIDAPCLRKVEERWGIPACSRNRMDQIFLQDLFHLRAQVDALPSVNVVLHLERMADLDYCALVLHDLTGQHYPSSLIEPLLQKRANSRTDAKVALPDVLNGFTREQREWYELVLADALPRCGFTAESEAVVNPPASAGTPQTDVLRPSANGMTDAHPPAAPLTEVLIRKDRQIASLLSRVEELERIWADVQASAGWRLLNGWRRWRRRLLPLGSRRRRAYESLLGKLRRRQTNRQ